MPISISTHSHALAAARLWISLAWLAVAAVGCGSAEPAVGGVDPGRLKPVFSSKTQRLEQLTYDTNGDGKIDIRGFMDGTRVIRAEVDEDGDGAVDRWEYYETNPASGAAGSGRVASPGRSWPAGTLARVEVAPKHDGKVTRWEYYEQGVIARVERDTDGDGQVDKWETYTNGVLAATAFDFEHRGRPDRRLVYRRDGSVERVERLEADPPVPAQVGVPSPR